MNSVSWFKIKERLKFLYQAHNAHGLHSPFAFELYNAIRRLLKVQKDDRASGSFRSKSCLYTLALCDYIKAKRILVISDQDEKYWSACFSKKSQVTIVKSLEDLDVSERMFDVLFVDNQLIINEKERLVKLLDCMHNDSVVIIPHIHASKNALEGWEKLKKERAVRISIDLFFIGLVFIRRESTKQDFLIRL